VRVVHVLSVCMRLLPVESEESLFELVLEH
jgi:hypothetical protein